MAPKAPQPKPIKQEKGASPAQTPGSKSIIAKASKRASQSILCDIYSLHVSRVTLIH